MKEKIMKSLVVALLFLFTLYLFQYFNESREKTSENVKEFIEKHEDYIFLSPENTHINI